MAIRVYEGEHSQAKYNHLLGQFVLNGIQTTLKGIPQIEVEFKIDADFNLTVHASELGT